MQDKGTTNLCTIRSLLLLIGMTVLHFGCTGGSEFSDGEGALPQEIDFNLHVRSILSESCFTCHGPDANAREAELRLDTEEGAFAPLKVSKGSFAITKGKPDESELYKRITSDDPDYMMPTPDSNLSLSERDIAILKRWIEEGAEYKKHWSFIVPEKSDLPRVANEDWPDSPVDYFVLAKLEQNGLKPSADAGKEKLLRRVSFDLTGLPPTVDEIEDFLSDTSPDAYERVVDRLLASPAYGERMAVEWLDVARYADSNGYQHDSSNEMWPWREWVIRAFNRNMPFDQFTTWQLAGDLLPDATRQQKLATGFNRVHKQNQEGGIVGEEYRVEYVADRVYTTATTFLGITMQCARCHDHKYDPVSEVEYYQFSAFFDNVNDAGQIPNEGAAGPTILLPDEETDALIAYLDEEISSNEQLLEDLKAGKAGKEEDFLRWQETADPALDQSDIPGLIAHLDLNVIQGDTAVTVAANEMETGRVSGTIHSVDGIADGALEFSHGNYINLGRDVAQFRRTDPFSFSFWINPSEKFNEVPVLVKTGAIYVGYKGYDISLFNNRVSLRVIHGWPFNAIQALSDQELNMNEWNQVVVTYDGSSNANGIRIFINGEEEETRIEHNNLFKNIVLAPDDLYGNQDFLVGYRTSFDNLSYDGLKLDEIKIFDRQLTPVEALALAGKEEDLQQMAAMDPDAIGEEQKKTLYDHYLLTYDPDYRQLSGKLHELRLEKSGVTDTLREVMVMEERLNPRQTYVRVRGQYDQLGEKVNPGVPESILEFPEDLPQNRLGLAQWLLSDEHPLTSRVIVNRYWQLLFGQGLVDTPDDFGNQGSLPSHPELLDWLAITFRENGWNIKNLLKEMVMSRTYRQSSVATPELRERDPQNRLLARGPRYRLQAEMIRDNALAASGLLVPEIGGPSVFPYQPDGLWAETAASRYLNKYVPSEGDGLYRRSLYTFWKRTSPPPGMTTFDAAMRTHPTAQRGRTSTPLQALNTLNDPIYVESSRLLAERMMKKGGDLDEQITFAFLALTSRYPEDWEVVELRHLYQKELSNYRSEPARAEKLLSVGEHPADTSFEAPELAARTIVANTILNLDETMTKE